MTISTFSDERVQVRTKKKEFSTSLNGSSRGREWLAMLQPCYYKGGCGNKPYPLETMLRLYLLQNLYDLSKSGQYAAKKAEHTKSSVRAKVEHVFCVVRKQLRFRKTRYRELEKQKTLLFWLVLL